MNIGGIVGDAISDAMGLAIMIGAGYGGVVVIDKGFNGVDYGLIVSERADGGYFVQLPDANQAVDAFLKEAPIALTQLGGLDISLKNVVLSEGQLMVDVTGTFEPTEAGAALRLNIWFRDSKKQGDTRIVLVGDFVQGEPSMSPVLPGLWGEVLAAFETPPARYDIYYSELNKLARELEK